MSSTILERDTRRRTAKAPPHRWRNRYWLDEGYVSTGGAVYVRGFNWSTKTWPSKEIAEQKALESIRQKTPRECGVRYIGAFRDPDA